MIRAIFRAIKLLRIIICSFMLLLLYGQHTLYIPERCEQAVQVVSEGGETVFDFHPVTWRV